MTKKRGNGEGSIYYNSQRKIWIGQYTINNAGKIKRSSVSGNTRKEVAKKLIDAQSKINNNIYIDKNNITLYQILTDINNQDLASNRIKESTYARTKNNINIILNKLTFSNIPIQKVSPEQINQDLIDNLKNYSNSVIGKIYGLIRKGFNKAVILKIIPSTPFNIDTLIVKPKSLNKTKKIESLTIDEELLFLQTLNDTNNKYKTIFLIATFTGMRIGEILALNKNDVDLKERVINIKRTLSKDKNDNVIIGDTTKTYAGERTIPIPDNIFNDINLAYNSTKNLLFTHIGKLICPATINLQFKRICLKANIRIAEKNGIAQSNVNTHMLRHTYATRCIESGMTPVVLSKLLGHKDIQTTLNTYTSVFNQYKSDEVKNSFTYLNKLGIINNKDSKDSLENKEILDETINILKDLYLSNEKKFIEVANIIKNQYSVCNAFATQQ